jgi:hypothetical protein
MNFAPILAALPALLGLIGSLFGNRKNPPKRADDILGGPSVKTDAAKAKEAADAAARAKFDK